MTGGLVDELVGQYCIELERWHRRDRGEFAYLRRNRAAG
jgi:hypothetical protein